MWGKGVGVIYKTSTLIMEGSPIGRREVGVRELVVEMMIIGSCMSDRWTCKQEGIIRAGSILCEIRSF